MDLKIRGQISAVFLTIILGVVIAFVGIFALATIDPIFSGRVYVCSFSNAAGTPDLALNGTVNETGTQSYTITNQGGGCGLWTNVTNISAGAGTIQVRTNGSATVLATITVPSTSSLTFVGNVTSAGSGTYVGNYTHIGTDRDNDQANITSGSYLRCCSSLTTTAGPAGTTYPALIATIGTIFTIIGLVLVIFGLGAAIGPLKKMAS